MADGPRSLLYQWMRNERAWVYGARSMTDAFSNWGVQYFLMRIAHNRTREAIEYLGKRWRALPDYLSEERVSALANRLECRALSSLSGPLDRMTLMRDTLLVQTGFAGTVAGGLEDIVASRVRNLDVGDLVSYIRQYAEWDRVSIVCAPV